jgi:hypothetical protein
LAQSPTHRFGQIIGDVLEAALHDPLAAVAKRHGLYLDCKCPRSARGGKSNVTWQDNKKNKHNLDYVLEAGGTKAKIGRPKAFIEIAYRRYTKHSRNKAQEIQGAIGPLFKTYAHDHPFLGAVLAGVFTDGSLAQLRSNGFGVLYIPFESIVRAFETIGIDANFDETSVDAHVKRKVGAWEKLTRKQRLSVGTVLRKLHRKDVAKFVAELEACLSRSVAAVFVLALHGQVQELKDVNSAIALIEGYEEKAAGGRFSRYEVNVRYTNGDEVRGSFMSKPEAILFLRALR